jgi:hypothetical protein
MNDMPMGSLTAADPDPLSTCLAADQLSREAQLLQTIRPVAWSLEDQGHAFRGKFLDICSIVETWALSVLNVAAARGKPGVGKTYLFGQKLTVISQVAADDVGKPSTDRTLKKPDRVVTLLDAFKPFADLRGQLGHARMSILREDRGETFFLFQSPSSRGDKQPWMQILLPLKQQKDILSSAAKLAKQISDQQTNPPSPPQPTPGAAGGP